MATDFTRSVIALDVQSVHVDIAAIHHHHEFVGLYRGSSLLELTSRAAQLAAKAMKLRVQVRSFDAMCQMIEANLGIGVLPSGVLRRPLPRTLAVIELNEPWARRRLLLGTSTHPERSPACRTGRLSRIAT